MTQLATSQPFEPRSTVADALVEAPTLTDAQMMERRRFDAANASSLWDGVSSSFAWVRDRTVKAWEATFYDDPNDPTFRLNEKLLNELTNGLPEQFWDRFKEAKSLQQAYAIKAGAHRDAENLGILQNSWGGASWIPMLGANVLDPTMLLAATVAGPLAGGIGKIAGLTEGLSAIISSGAVVGGTMAGVETFYKSGDSSISNWDIASAGAGGFGLGAGLKGAAAASRTARALATGSGAAAGTMTVESARAIIERDRSIKDILYAGLNQMAFGAFLGFVHGTSIDPETSRVMKVAADNAQKAVLAQGLADAGAGLSESGKQMLAPVTDPAFYPKLTEQLTDGIEGLPPVDTTLPPPEPGPLVSVGAASPAELAGMDATAKAKAELDASRTPGDLNLSNVTDAKSWGWSLGDMSSLVGKSAVSAFRRASAMLSRDLLPRTDEAGRLVPTVESAAERARRVIQVNEAELAGKFNKAFDAWKKTDPEIPDGVSAWEHFNDLVGRTTLGIGTDDANVNSAANVGRTIAERNLKMAQRYGDRSFDGVEADPNYFPLHTLLKKVNDAIGKYGEQNVYRLMGEAFRKMFPELSQELAYIWGEGYVRNIRINRLGLHDLEHYFSGRDTEAAITAMREAGIKITDPQAQEFLDTVKWTKPEAGASPRAMRARGFDRTFSLPMVDVNGQTGNLSVMDLIDTHALRVWGSYNKHMVGRAVMAEVYRSTDPTGKIATFNDYLTFLRAEGDKHIETNPGLKDQVRLDYDRLAIMARSVLQMPLRDKTAGTDVLRALRAFQYVRVLGSHFAAHLGNLGHLLTNGGVMNMLAHIDSFADMVRTARDGEFNSKIVREVAALAADGQEPLRMSVANHFDTLAPWDDPATPNAPTTLVNRTAQSVMPLLEKGKRVQDTLSTFNRVNTFIQRASGIMAEQRLFDDAKQFVKSGRLPSAERLAAIGFTPEDAPAFMRMIYEHADTETSWLGTEKIVQTNPGAWPDQNLAARYINALDKTTRRWAQRGEVGDMAKWMTREDGKTLIQFRQYHYLAYRNQLLFGLRMNDFEAWTSFALTSLVGAMAYVGLTYTRSLGKPADEKAKFLAATLTPTKIGLAAFQRSSFSSVFPMFADAGGEYTGLYDPPFHHVRTSGLANDPIFGNPTIDFFDTMRRTVPSAIGSLRSDKQFTRENMQDLKNLLPFSRMLGISNILDQLGKNLPRKPEQE